LATPAATSVVASAAATATPRIAGVAVSENGDTTPVNTVATEQSSSRRTYVWFGTGVIVLLLVAVALALRRRAGAHQ
jgi:putative Ca2+/H+ antiporter (TMEM165/GDT1 family)